MITIELISMAGDELRWQPWQYQFLFILFAILINKKHPRFAINSIILILASTYFFSGLEKLNSGFLQTIWLKLVLIHFLHLPQSVYQSRLIRYAGLLIPLVEIAAGILILLPKQQKIFAWLPIGIHVFIWVFLGAQGIQNNQTVLPWNAAMPILIYILFIRNRSLFSFSGLLYRWNIAVPVAWVLLPVAGMFGYWDKYFSSGVYSGNNKYMNIYIGDTVSIPSELKLYVYFSAKGYHDLHKVITVQSWSVKELKVSVPPEPRIYKSIELSFKEKYSFLQPEFLYY